MALNHIVYTLSTTPQPLLTVPGAGPRKIYIENRSTANAVNLGDSSITNASGYQLTAQASTGVGNRLEIELFGGDVLWGCSTASTAVVSILVPGA